MIDPTRLVILGTALVIFAIVLIVGGKTDAERENPDRATTPMRDQWPISVLYGKDWNLRSFAALICIVLGFTLQTVALAMLS